MLVLGHIFTLNADIIPYHTVSGDTQCNVMIKYKMKFKMIHYDV